jgi:hypothetical protein
METEFREESLAIAQTLKAHAEKKGMSAGDFAVNWVLANPDRHQRDRGPRTLEQWKAYLGALGKASMPRTRAGRLARKPRPSVDSGLQRSGIPDDGTPPLARGARAAAGVVSLSFHHPQDGPCRCASPFAASCS